MSKLVYFISAVSIMFIMTCNAAFNSSTTAPPICAPSDCGNGLPIQYPFWKRSDVTAAGGICGYPQFGLTCSKDGQPIIKLNDNPYFVTDINYDNNSITLVDIDAVSMTCPRAKHNVSLGNYPLSFSQLDQNITFYFNCSSYPSTISPISCLEGNTSVGKKSYVFYAGQEPSGYDWNRNCDPEIVVTVKQHEIQSAGLIEYGFGVAMNKGFVLDWSRAVNCAECELSKGYCGFNETTKVTMCMCEDGSVVANSCKVIVAGSHLNWKLKIFIGVAAIVISVLLVLCCLICKSSGWKAKSWFPTKISNQDIEAFLKNHGDLALKRYKFSDVKKMTNSFKTKLGQGGFGSVYKGKLVNGSDVAVKILNPSKGNGEEFINEIASISRTSHVNVVTLLGFCLEGHKKVLVYEFMSNGSLDKFICEKGHGNTQSLSWDNLYQIAIGIARGLEYLHRGCNTRILHFDIKPHNILLDENFCPKISDFGLAKLGPRKESIVSMSNARGTIGYIAPEVWNRHFGRVSHKSDVYSYGMMLIEMVGGRNKVNAKTSGTSEMYFPDWIYNRLEEGTPSRIDGEVTIEENEVIKRITMIGLWCIQTIPDDRPTMSKVVEMLEGNINSLEMPPKPVLTSPVRSQVESSLVESLTMVSRN